MEIFQITFQHVSNYFRNSLEPKIKQNHITNVLTEYKRRKNGKRVIRRSPWPRPISSPSVVFLLRQSEQELAAASPGAPTHLCACVARPDELESEDKPPRARSHPLPLLTRPLHLSLSAAIAASSSYSSLRPSSLASEFAVRSTSSSWSSLPKEKSP